MKYFLCVFVFFFMLSCTTKTKPVLLLAEGIPLEMASYRKSQVTDVVYNLTFNIPLKIEDSIASRLILNLNIKNLEQPLYLDFNEDKSHIKSIVVNGKDVEINHQKQHLIIDQKDLKSGSNTIDILFIAGELSLNRNDEFLYTLLVPDRASTLFPCFDQPDIKANYVLTITAPKDWKVLCGGLVINTEIKGDYSTHWFAKTDPMSTYLFSFVAGKFSETVENSGKLKMHFLYRENNEEKITESIDEVFKIHEQSIGFLEKYTDYKFPFQKLDFVTIPPFQYGGMEHVGAIQYRESSLFLDKNATQDNLVSRAKLIAHETSHMWFGDLVTMRWFDDVWMKEVFANFMADKIMNPVFPEINHTLQFMMSHYPSAYSEDRTQGTNAIRQSLSNLKNAGSLYGRIIYDKAPIMMRQLEYQLGENTFQKGIQNYIKKYAYKNADWNDLVNILDNESPKDIKTWSKTWVNSSSRPIFTDSIKYKNGRINSFKIFQKAEDNSNNIWTQSFDIGFVYGDSVKVVNVEINQAKQVLKEVIGFEKPKQIIYNYNGFGYGVFPINKIDISLIKNVENDIARGYTYINLYENFLNFKIPAFETYNTFLEGLLNENNEQIFRYLSGSLQTIYWKFLNESQQLETQAYTEAQILNKLKSNISPNFKKVLFYLYKSIAISPHGMSELYNIWVKKETISNLNLNEDDYIDLAMQLAIFNHPKAEDILNAQEQLISNPDELARFKWLLPSLSNKLSIRDAFMVSLYKPENREKESWVEDALSNINHPLRQAYSVKYLSKCLNLLEEIQLTGDIFFPKQWLSNSVGKYSSKEAYNLVQEFLKQHPDYNPILKKKLMQTIDNLFRAQKIKIE